MDDVETWDLIHAERGSVAEMLSSLTPAQWAAPALCSGWSVQVTAGHIVVGAEQTKGRFMKRMAANAFRFNAMMDRDARRMAQLPTSDIIERLRATTTTTNGPPAPAVTMLGEIVVHGEDIRLPLGLPNQTDPAALVACLEMFSGASFPVGTKKRIAGLRLNPTDVDWSHGDGPEVTGPASAMLSAMTGRAGGLAGLSGDGLATLRSRLPAAA